jgi:hypothetical protein
MSHWKRAGNTRSLQPKRAILSCCTQIYADRFSGHYEEGDLSRDVIREAMKDAGWRAVSIVAIDEVWSAIALPSGGPSWFALEERPRTEAGMRDSQFPSEGAGFPILPTLK